MRNYRWNQFSYRDEEIPETPFEASVFLDHATQHLNNRIDGPLGETFDIIMGARTAVNKSIFEEAA